MIDLNKIKDRLPVGVSEPAPPEYINRPRLPQRAPQAASLPPVATVPRSPLPSQSAYGMPYTPRQNVTPQYGNPAALIAAYRQAAPKPAAAVTDGEKLKAFGNAGYAGLTATNRSLWNVPKAIEDVAKNILHTPDDAGLFTGIQKHYADIDNTAQQQVQQDVANKKIGVVGAGLIQGVVGAVPSALAAMASGGQTLAPQLGSAASTLGRQVLTGVKSLAANPAFQLSALRTFGNSYETALNDGANVYQAVNAAVLSSVPQSIIEVSGGSEKLVEGLLRGKQGLTGKVLQSALEEGIEEILQYPFEGLAKKSTYQPNLPLFSLDRQAVINPVEQTKNAAMGGAVGLIMGGGAKAAEGVARYGVKPANPAKQADMPVYGQTDTTVQDPLPAASPTPPHVKTMPEIVQEYNAAADQDIIDYVERIQKDPTSKESFIIGRMGNKSGKEVAALVGLDTTGFSVAITPETIRHIKNRHGEQGSADHSMSDINDLARIKYVLKNCDTVAKDPTTSKAFSNSDGKPAAKVVYSKRVNGTYYVVEAVPNTKAQTLQIVTAFKTKATPQAPLTNVVESTSENAPMSVAYDPTIPQGNNGVNTQSMQGGGENTVGAAHHNPASYSGMITDHGTIKPGENPARMVDVPKRNANNQPISEAARTIMEAGVTADAEVEMMERMIESGELVHEVITDKQAMGQARRTIEYDGWDGALNDWNAAVKKRKFDKETIALGQMIYNQAVQNKDVPLVKKMIVDLTLAASESGRNLQATRMLKKLTPDGKLYGLEQSVRSINEDLYARYGKKFSNIEIPINLAAELLNSSGGTETEAAVSKIEQYIADRIPSTLMDKWNAWRYLAMLGNLRTHGKNLIGNAVFVPAVKLKNLVANSLESTVNMGLSAAGKEQIARTKAVTFDKAVRSFAEDDFTNVENVLRGGGKHNPSNSINDKRRIFNSKLLEGYRTGNSNALEAEDALFLKLHYVDSLSSYMAANKLTADYLNGNTRAAMTALHNARTYAIGEAQKATYRDANAVASFLNNSKRNLNGKGGWGKVASAGLEGLVPFTKTPANILRRGLEYSPAGLAKGLTYDLARVKSGEVTAAQAIDNIASGLTGTGILVLGMWLHSLGLLSGGREEDKNQADFDRLNGAQNYALKLEGRSYTIDWLAPMSLPLFVGAEIDQIRRGEGFSSVNDYADALLKIAEPMVEMSMLQGINNAFRSIAYSDGNALTAFGTELATSYLSQGVPTLFGQVARAVDPVRRNTTFVDPTGGLPAALQKPINRAVAKIPFASQTLPPMIDQWGREQQNTGGNFAGRLANNMLSPGYYSNNKAGSLEDELQRLYDKTGDAKVLPSYAAKSIKYDNETIKFGAGQYSLFAGQKGRISRETAQEIVENKVYSTLNDEQKAFAISKAYDYATALAKANVSAYKLTDSDKEIQKLSERDISPAVYIVAYTAQKDIKSDKDSNGKTIYLSASKKAKAAVDQATPGKSRLQRQALYRVFDISEQVW